jgi:hypothetical protein
MQDGKHIVTIEQKKFLSISAVESVVAFSEVKIVLALAGNNRLTVVGTGLKITGFSKTTGAFTAEGTIIGVSYGGKSFASRLFK